MTNEEFDALRQAIAANGPTSHVTRLMGEAIRLRAEAAALRAERMTDMRAAVIVKRLERWDREAVYLTHEWREDFDGLLADRAFLRRLLSDRVQESALAMEEREAVVAWLRSLEESNTTFAADYIEAGRHREEKPRAARNG